MLEFMVNATPINAVSVKHKNVRQKRRITFRPWVYVFLVVLISTVSIVGYDSYSVG